MKTFENIPRTGEIDLRNAPAEEVVAFLDQTIAEEDWVLHGSDGRYLFLQPQLGHDLYRKEGCRTAIYATQLAPQALYRAILNRRLRGTVSTFCRQLNEVSEQNTLIAPQVAGFKSPDGIRGLYAFAEPMYSAMISGDTDLTQDGFVYALDKAAFTQEGGDPHADWQSYEAVVPRAVYHINKNMARFLFQPPGTHPRFEARLYTSEESMDHRRALGLDTSQAA